MSQANSVSADTEDARLAAAIHAHRLAAVLDDLPRTDTTDRARKALKHIEADIADQRTTFEAACQARGIPITGIETAQQFHAMRVRIAPRDLPAALDVAAAQGAPVARLFSVGAARAYARFENQITLMQPGENTFRLTLQWRDTPRPGLVPAKLRPNMLDFGFARLPGWLGWAYPFVRPLRVLYQKMTKRNLADEADTFLATVSLGTPAALLEELFALGRLGPQDCLLDIGCGDARALVEAVQSTGCRAIGIERNKPLAARAVARVRDAGLEDKITIHARLADPEDIAAATLVFMFHPPALLAQLLPMVLAHRSPDCRVLVHEQAGLQFETPPDVTKPVFADNALTVAHLWNADQADGVSVNQGEHP